MWLDCNCWLLTTMTSEPYGEKRQNFVCLLFLRNSKIRFLSEKGNLNNSNEIEILLWWFSVLSISRGIVKWTSSTIVYFVLDQCNLIWKWKIDEKNYPTEQKCWASKNSILWIDLALPSELLINRGITLYREDGLECHLPENGGSLSKLIVN